MVLVVNNPLARAGDLISQFSHSVVSNSLRPHEPQHARPPCPSPTPGVHPNSCLLSRWCHPTISSSVIPFSSCPQSFPASGDWIDMDWIPGSGRSPEGGHGDPLQCSYLENPMGRGTWKATVHGVAKSQTRLKGLSTHTDKHTCVSPLEKFYERGILHH